MNRLATEPGHVSTVTSSRAHIALTRSELEVIAWRFLGSQFAELIYADWPIDRRLDAYLTHEDMAHVVNDGDAYNAVLQHVLASISGARRVGILANTSWLALRRDWDKPHSPATTLRLEQAQPLERRSADRNESRLRTE